MKSRIAIKDIETAVRIYYQHPELGTAEIKELFNCSASTACRMKDRARALQKKENVMTFSDARVNTSCAYRAWRLDIAEMERLMLKYRKMQAKGV